MAAETEYDLAPHKEPAVVLIQRSYRGYRARRKLADAAIMSKRVGWWNVVDSAVLHQQTLQYYAHSKSWKANDNWKRLKRKASKLGKGLEKNNKALKLALQHWLEAVDARHRYGHNLRPYYLEWHELETTEPFFYWLDLGSGRQVEMEECSRAILHEEQITYLSPDQRRHFEVAIYHGKLYYQSSGELVHTPEGDRYIFVMSPSYKLYIGKKRRGKFQHSSFLAGGATTAAGRLVVQHGVLKLMEAHSGHYRPSPENFEGLVRILVNRGADLHLAKVQLTSDDLLEKEKAEALAKEVREAVEGAHGDSNVEVKVEDQQLVSVDSPCHSEYVVTNLTFAGLADKAQAAAEQEAKAKDPEPEQTKTVVPNSGPEGVQKQEPALVEANPVPQGELEKLAAMEENPVEKQPEEKEEEAVVVEEIPTENPVEKPVETETLVEHNVVKKLPSALVVPVASAVEKELGVDPKTATVPSSPGFSRNTILANLESQHRRETLKKYGPRKLGFAAKTLESIPLTC